MGEEKKKIEQFAVALGLVNPFSFYRLFCRPYKTCFAVHRLIRTGKLQLECSLGKVELREDHFHASDIIVPSSSFPIYQCTSGTMKNEHSIAYVFY